MGVIASALATGAATYAARKATPKTTQENYNFGGDETPGSEDPSAANSGFNAKRNDPAMADEYLGTKPTTVGGAAQNVVTNKLEAPWERMIGKFGSGGNAKSPYFS